MKLNQFFEIVFASLGCLLFVDSSRGKGMLGFSVVLVFKAGCRDELSAFFHLLAEDDVNYVRMILVITFGKSFCLYFLIVLFGIFKKN